MGVSSDALGDQRAQVVMQDRGPVADRVEILDKAENLVSGFADPHLVAISHPVRIFMLQAVESLPLRCQISAQVHGTPAQPAEVLSDLTDIGFKKLIFQPVN